MAPAAALGDLPALVHDPPGALGHRLGLAAPDLGLAAVDLAADGPDGRLGRAGAGGGQRLVGGLDAGVVRHGRAEVVVDPVHHAGDGAEVAGQGLRAAYVVLELLVEGDVGAAEAVDRLLWVAYQAELSGGQGEGLPGGPLSLALPRKGGGEVAGGV